MTRSIVHQKLAELPSMVMIATASVLVAITAIFCPPAIAGGLGAIIVAGVLCWVLTPAGAIRIFPTMLIIAGTKFRGRDATALVGGSIDSQIMFELGIYAIVAVVTVVNMVTIDELPAPRPMEIALLTYASIALASVAWSVSPAISAVRASQQMLLLITACIAVRIVEPKNLFRSFGKQLLAYVTICASLAIVFPSFNGTQIGYLAGAHRFSWFAVHPVSAATESGMALVFIVALALFGKGWKFRLYKIPLWIYAGALVLIILATRTRTAIFSTLAAGSFLCLVRYKRNPGVWVTGAGLLLGALLFAIITPQLGQSVQSYVLRGQDVGQFTSLTGRTALWRESLRMFSERPLFGYGYVASRALLLQVLAWAGEAHNAVVESLLDVGIIGASALFIPFLAGLTGSVRMLRRWRPGDDPVIAWTAGAMIFLVMDGIPMASFAGFLTFDPILMITAVVTFQAIRSRRQSGSEDRFKMNSIQRVPDYA